MGYNISVACHNCRVRCGALRGQEAVVIKRFVNMHPGREHRREIRVDNGWSEPDEFPIEYRDVYDEVVAYRAPKVPR